MTAHLDSSVWVYSDTAAVLRPDAEEPLQQFANQLAGSATGIAPGGVDDARFFVTAVVDGGRRIGTVVTAVNVSRPNAPRH